MTTAIVVLLVAAALAAGFYLWNRAGAPTGPGLATGTATATPGGASPTTDFMSRFFPSSSSGSGSVTIRTGGAKGGTLPSDEGFFG